LIACLNAGDIAHAIKCAESFNLPERYRLKRAVRVFGEFMTYDVWQDFNHLLDGQVVADFSDLKLKKTGEAGALELERILRGLRHNFLFSETATHPDLIAAMRNPAFASVAKGLSRFTSSEWGAHDEDIWQKIIETYVRLHKESKIDPLPTGYIQSDTIQVATLEEKAKDFTYSKDFLARFRLLVKDITKAQEHVRAHPEGGFATDAIARLEKATNTFVGETKKNSRITKPCKQTQTRQ
ncbi:MAG: hypothetical protein WC654_01030, partial [Patescibacteria group bacterium]